LLKAAYALSGCGVDKPPSSWAVLNLLRVSSDVNVSANNWLAVATFLGTIYCTADGKETMLQNRYTVTLSKLRANDPWRILSSHLTRKM
jgi:hypothetical protein